MSDNRTVDEEEFEKQKKGTDEQNEECAAFLKKTCYYEILDIDRESNEDEIKKSYKKLAIKFHPDKNQSENAAEVFKKVKLFCKIYFRFHTRLQR